MFVILTVFGREAKKGKPGELCLRSSASGDGAPVISFHGEGDCRAPRRYGGAPLATLRGATARIVESVLREAGVETKHLERGEFDPRATLDYCSSTDAELLGKLGENQTVSQIPGYGAFTTKDALARNVNAYAALHPEIGDVIPRTYALPGDWKRLSVENAAF